MAKEIKYLDLERKLYEDFDWKREDVNDFLKNYQVINVETLKDTIRFWYKKD